MDGTTVPLGRTSSMGQLINLQSYREAARGADERTVQGHADGEPSAQGAREALAHAARVLLFTGVRYERMDEPRRERVGG